eukprot:354548-Chlamydomonas_euryale.AAC.17
MHGAATDDAAAADWPNDTRAARHRNAHPTLDQAPEHLDVDPRNGSVANVRAAAGTRQVVGLMPYTIAFRALSMLRCRRRFAGIRSANGRFVLAYVLQNGRSPNPRVVRVLHSSYVASRWNRLGCGWDAQDTILAR